MLNYTVQVQQIPQNSATLVTVFQFCCYSFPLASSTTEEIFNNNQPELPLLHSDFTLTSPPPLSPSFSSL